MILGKRYREELQVVQYCNKKADKVIFYFISYNNINNFHEFNCNDYNCDYHSPMEICDIEVTKKKTKQKKSFTEKFNSSSNNSFYTNYSKG